MKRWLEVLNEVWQHRYFRATAVLLIGLVAAIKFLLFLGTGYPIKDWLFLRLATIWGWDAFLSIAFLSTGNLLLTRVFKLGDLSNIERLSLSAGIGAVVFTMGMYAGGFLALYGPVFGVALPGVMLLAGLRAGMPTLRAILSGPRVSFSILGIAATLFGTLCVGVLYLGVLSPDSVNYDATWNHLVIAQDYGREGRIVPFLADWVKNVPHLGSIINTWAFLVPGLELPALRWMMALHNEFTFFLWTLVGVAAVVRWLTGRRDIRGTWAAFFLFPAIFVYDSNMGTAADHFLAFFIPPLFLAAVRALDRFELRACVLTGMLAAAALLTKLHASYVLGPIAIAFAARWVMLTIHRVRGAKDLPPLKDSLIGLGGLAASGLVFTSPHFVKNWVFYKNPFYPLAQRQFPASTPGLPDAATQIDYLFADWHYHVPKELGPRLLGAAKIAFSYSFEPHYSFIGGRVISGSLFTLGLLFLPFLPNARRLWFGAFVGVGALFCWGFTFWVDRNLQTFTPLLVGVACAILVRAWELGLLARVAVAALVCVQLVWGADFYFSGSDRIAGAISLIRSGLDGRAQDRFNSYRAEYVRLGRALPKNATVVLHNSHVMLGIDRRVFLDWVGFQGLIDYRTFKTPRDLYDRFRQVGATHIAYTPGARTPASKQEAVVFDEFVAFYGEHAESFGGLRLSTLPAEPPPARAPLQVLSVGVSGYADGIYPVDALSVCEEMPPNMQHFPKPSHAVRSRSAASDLVPSVDVVLLGSGVSLGKLAGMERISSYREFSVYARDDR